MKQIHNLDQAFQVEFYEFCMQPQKNSFSCVHQMLKDSTGWLGKYLKKEG